MPAASTRNLTPPPAAMTPEEALAAAVKAVGSKRKIAKLLKVSHPAVSQWKVCPPKRAKSLAEISGISAALLCPEFMPDDS